MAVNSCVQYRTCSNLTTCEIPTAMHAAGQYVSTRSTTTSDRNCSALATCDYAQQYEHPVATRFSNRVCNNVTVCNFTVQFKGFLNSKLISPPVHCTSSSQKTKISRRFCLCSLHYGVFWHIRLSR